MPILCCFTIFMFVPRCPSFVVSRYFRFHRNAFLFVAPRYLCLHRDAIFLLLHDISNFTAMPFFVAPRYLCLHRDAIFCYFTILLNSPRCLLFVESRYFHFTTNSCRSPTLTPLFSGGTSEVQTSEHHKTSREVRASKLCHRCPVRLQHGVRK